MHVYNHVCTVGVHVLVRTYYVYVRTYVCM